MITNYSKLPVSQVCRFVWTGIDNNDTHWADGWTIKDTQIFLDSVLVKRDLKQSQFKLHFSFVLCEVKVIPIHVFLKINLKRVTVNCVTWASSHRWGHGVSGQHLLIFFFSITTGQPSGSAEKSRAFRGGHVNWWPPRSAVPWPPPCSETLSSGKKDRNANFQKISLVWSNTFRLST